MNRSFFSRCLAGGTALVISISASVASATLVYVDLSGATAGVPTTGGSWNQITDASTGAIADLVDTTGALTGIGAAVTDDFSLSGGGTWGAGSSWFNDDKATLDSFHVTTNVSAAGASGEITFDGLDVSKTYNVEIVSSRSSGNATNRSGTFTINGSNSDNFPGTYSAFVDGFTNNTLMTWASLSPNGAGEFVLDVSTAGGGNHGYLNAISIETVAVPEPSSFALVGLLAVSLVTKRRRC